MDIGDWYEIHGCGRRDLRSDRSVGASAVFDGPDLPCPVVDALNNSSKLLL